MSRAVSCLVAVAVVAVALAGVGGVTAQADDDGTTGNETAGNGTTQAATATPSLGELSTAVAERRTAVAETRANGGAVQPAVVGLLAGVGGGLLVGTVVRYWGVGR
ncbi:hypothetical protein [Halobaculum sp. MBLA0143]|uniref:hypothetical protein n=1 Tax=Halobaculum sp. MBLA0143 TaxID=3079933 RepID=UPI0035259AC8